jgi:hypothetical protein
MHQRTPYNLILHVDVVSHNIFCCLFSIKSLKPTQMSIKFYGLENDERNNCCSKFYSWLRRALCSFDAWIFVGSNIICRPSFACGMVQQHGCYRACNSDNFTVTSLLIPLEFAFTTNRGLKHKSTGAKFTS